MDLNDFVLLSNEQKNELINAYQVKPLEYRVSNCLCDYLYSLEPCSVCKNWFEERKDTEGKVNGGIGMVCEQCYEDCGIGE